MRKEFIIVLLGIILTSTLSSLMSGTVSVSSDKILLDTVVGTVGAGNFSYWQLGHSGHLVVELRSLTGDADLYVSDSTSLRPSFQIENNNFSSATCGLDVVDIPWDFPRPIGIGVFGHWSHAVSEYSIQVFSKHQHMNEEWTKFLADQLSDIDQSEKTSVKDSKQHHHHSRVDEQDPNRAIMFFRLLGTVFEMFDIFTF